MNGKIFTAQAGLVKALAHQSRLEIIHLLRHHVLTVGQITSMLGVTQSAISQHLATLKTAGIVTSRREGKEIYYAVADARIIHACDALRSLVSRDPLPTSPEPEVIDPVCGMELTPKTSAYQETYNGVRHYFCAKGCYQKFIQNSAHYVR